MGIELGDAQFIIRSLRSLPLSKRRRALILGNCTVHCNLDELGSIARNEGFELRHAEKDGSPLDVHTLFDKLGFDSVKTLDINGNADLCVDLTKEVPEELLSSFDYILDAGVLFWCFEPGRAINNLVRLCRYEAIIAHITYMSGSYGLGYFNIHPAFFNDFYTLNGFKMVIYSCRTRESRKRWQRGMKRLMSYLRRQPAGVGYTWYSINEGCVFLEAGGGRTVKLASSQTEWEPEFIPNRIIYCCAYVLSESPNGNVSHPVLAGD